MPNASLRDRLRSADLVTSAAASVELGRTLVDALRGALLIDGEPSAPVTVSRALADVTSADLAGVLPPVQIVPPVWPTRPLFSIATRLEQSGSYIGAQIDALPAVMIDPAPEKSAQTGTLWPIPSRPIPAHLAMVLLGNLSVAVVERSQPDVITFMDAMAEAAAQQALEPVLMADLVASPGIETVPDVLAGVAVANDYGGTVYVLTTGQQFPAVMTALGPSGLLASGAVRVIPVAGGPLDGLLVVSGGNLDVRLSDVITLATNDAARLGVDRSVGWQALAMIHYPSAAAIVTATP